MDSDSFVLTLGSDKPTERKRKEEKWRPEPGRDVLDHQGGGALLQAIHKWTTGLGSPARPDAVEMVLPRRGRHGRRRAPLYSIKFSYFHLQRFFSMLNNRTCIELKLRIENSADRQFMTLVATLVATYSTFDAIVES